MERLGQTGVALKEAELQPRMWAGTFCPAIKPCLVKDQESVFLGFIFFVAYFCLLLKPKSTTDGVEQPLLILINDAHNATTLGMSQRPCHVQKY